MRKWQKLGGKFLSVFLAAVMLFGISLSVNAGIDGTVNGTTYGHTKDFKYYYLTSTAAVGNDNNLHVTQYIGTSPNATLGQVFGSRKLMIHSGTFGDNVTSITFSKDVPLEKITSGFSGCKFQTVTINGSSGSSAGVKAIGDGAFRYCSNLTTVDLGYAGVTTIGSYAFANCPKMTRIYIPKSVTSIGTNAFSGAQNLVIYGIKSSTAETYAKSNGITFKESTTLVSAVPATCTTNGKQAYYHSVWNGNNYTGAEGYPAQFISNINTWGVVAATGHTWNTPTYTWSDDNKTVTAKRVCKKDTNHVETETVNTSYVVTEDSTCMADGTGTFTATFKNTGFAKQTKNIVLPLTGHDWNAPVYTWSDDNLTVTATRTCQNDPDHVETETVNTTYEVTETATTEKVGAGIFTAVFETPAFYVQTKEVEIPVVFENTSVLSANEIELGESVTINASAWGGAGRYQYAVQYKKSADTKWTYAQNYSTNATITVTPAKATTYDICVLVKDRRANVAKQYFTVTVEPAKLVNTSTISTETVPLGESVTVNAAATGGIAPYTYAVYYRKATDTKWTTAQAYSTNTAVAVTPMKKTNYDICVKVKDKNGTIEEKILAVTVTDAKLQNTSTVSAEEVALGESVTVNCSATGGKAPYQYMVQYKKETDIKYTNVQAYSTNSTVSFKPMKKVNYLVLVKAKDSKGTVASTSFMVRVQ